ncbi:hypothetical protein Tco_1042039 [Tanacetum coccineum]|uniref:Uncharacterized protein n=1 Tax=Tanacetum coccineum TaxID=301880 RepID=A0ABQ5GJ37_9ASTR
MTLFNQDLFYLKNGNSETRKYVLSLHKVHAFLLPENDLEELNTRWSLWAQQSHIKRKLKTRDDPEEVHSEKRIVDVIRVQYDQGYEQEYMEEIVVKRADGEFKSFTKSDYKYLHNNDIEDMYLMCINGKIKDYRETRLLKSLNKVNLTAPTLTFPSIDEQKLYTINSDPLVGFIYENSKKEDPALSNDDAEFVRFYEEYIRERLRHRDQMRRWESYVNGRPLEQRRDHPK